MTKELLPLYPGARPCVRSGYCCKKAPCGYGTWDAGKTQCAYLQKDADGRYECGIIDKIVGSPGWQISPAFGAGCCSPLNSDRLGILARGTDRGHGGAAEGHDAEHAVG